jgi:hypothetical protein
MDDLRYEIELQRDAVGQENLLPQDDMNQTSIDGFDRLVPLLRSALDKSNDFDDQQKQYLDDAFATMKSLSVEGAMEKSRKHFQTPFRTLEDTAIPMFDAELYSELVEVFEGIPNQNKDEKEKAVAFMRNLGALCLYWEQSLSVPRAAEEHIDSITIASMEFEAIDLYEEGMEQVVRAYNGLGVDLEKFKDIPSAPQTQSEYALDLDQVQRETFENYVVPALKANPGWMDDPTTADALALVYGEFKAEDLVNEYFGGASVQTRYVSQPIHNALRNRMLAFVHTAKYRNQLDTNSAEVFNVAPNDALFFNFTQPLLNAFAEGVAGPDPVLFAEFKKASSFVESVAKDEVKAGPSKSVFAKTPKSRKRVRSKSPPKVDATLPKRQKPLRVGEKINPSENAEEFASTIRIATDRFGAISDRILELFDVEIPKGWTTSASLQEAWSKATLLAQLEEVFETGEIPIGFQWFNPITAVGNAAIKAASVTGRTILGAGKKLVSLCGRLVKGTPDWLRDVIVKLGEGAEFVTKLPYVQLIAVIVALVSGTGYLPAAAATVASWGISTVQVLNIATLLKRVYTENNDKQRNAAIAASLIQFVPLAGDRILSALALPGAGVFREINMLSFYTFSGLATVQLVADVNKAWNDFNESRVGNFSKKFASLLGMVSVSNAATLYYLFGTQGLVAGILLGGLATAASADEVIITSSQPLDNPYEYVDGSQLEVEKLITKQAKKQFTNLLRVANERFDKTRKNRQDIPGKAIIELAKMFTGEDAETAPEALVLIARGATPGAVEVSRYYQRQAIHATMRSAYQVSDKELDPNSVLTSTGFGLAAGVAVLFADSILVGSATAVADSIGLAGAIGTIGTGVGTVSSMLFGATATSALIALAPVGVPAALLLASVATAFAAKITEKQPDDSDDESMITDSDSDTDDDEPSGPTGPPAPFIPPNGVPDSNPGRAALLQSMYDEWAVVADVEDQTRQAIIRRMLRRTRASTPPAPALRKTRRRLRRTRSMSPFGQKIGQSVNDEPLLRSFGEIMQRIAKRELELEDLDEIETVTVAGIAEAFATSRAAQEMLLGFPGPVQVRSAQIKDPESMTLEGQEAETISLQAYARRVMEKTPQLFTPDFNRRFDVLRESLPEFNKLYARIVNLSANDTGLVTQQDAASVEPYIELSILIERFVFSLSG